MYAHAQHLRFLPIRLLPERIRPLFLHPIRIHRIRRKNQQNKIRLEPLLDAAHNILPRPNLAFVQPNLDMPIASQKISHLRTNGLSLLEWLRKTEIMKTRAKPQKYSPHHSEIELLSPKSPHPKTR